MLGTKTTRPSSRRYTKEAKKLWGMDIDALKDKLREVKDALVIPDE